VFSLNSSICFRASLTTDFRLFTTLKISHCSIKCLILCLILFQVDASTNTDPDAYFDNKIGDIEKNINKTVEIVVYYKVVHTKTKQSRLAYIL
jgi:hypothetical protein